jgi:RimJ/RimL family protein N-acetyltransferase
VKPGRGTAPTLIGRALVLEPLGEAHRRPLQMAAQDSRIWAYMSHAGETTDGFEAWFEAAQTGVAAGSAVVYAVRRRSDTRLVGSSRFMNIADEHRRREIGNTWYVPSAWGTRVNPECKLLLLQHAFEVLDLLRVEFRCDARNERSRQALARLGSVEEGVLRRHMIVRDGFVRDTVQFSVLREEWPAVRAGLEARLAQA